MEPGPRSTRNSSRTSIDSSEQDLISTANGLRFVVPSGQEEAYRFADPDRLALSVAANSTKGRIEPRHRYLDALRSFWKRAVFLRLSPLRIAQGSHPLRKAFDPLLDQEGRLLPALLGEFRSSQIEKLVQAIQKALPGIRGVEVLRRKRADQSPRSRCWSRCHRRVEAVRVRSRFRPGCSPKAHGGSRPSWLSSRMSRLRPCSASKRSRTDSIPGRAGCPRGAEVRVPPRHPGRRHNAFALAAGPRGSRRHPSRRENRGGHGLLAFAGGRQATWAVYPERPEEHHFPGNCDKSPALMQRPRTGGRQLLNRTAVGSSLRSFTHTVMPPEKGGELIVRPPGRS